MKNIVVTGTSGYIATHIKNWLEEKHPNKYTVRLLNLRNDRWQNESLHDADVIVHTAGIVHRTDIKDWDTYYRINVLLTEHLAFKAKKEGVKQFIFFSSMSVYGASKQLNGEIITVNTQLKPKSLYGKSKLQAELILNKMSDSNFCVSVVRPPNVYGYGCKGNYIKMFRKAAQFLPFIPLAYQNVMQSMIYIDNLCELIRLIIDEKSGGEFTPQDLPPVSTVQLLKEISYSLEKKIPVSRCAGKVVKIFSFLKIVKKVYGGVQYDVAMSGCFDNRYLVCSFGDAMRLTFIERNERN